MTRTAMRFTTCPLLHEAQGAVSTEYVVLVGTMGLVLVVALVTVGPSLVRSFQATRTVVAAPFP
jgi:Flp pilus assembly pilin Flp